MAMLPWWIHYPNVNNEIINLDWILQISNENTDKIENFIGVNTIKYADPILWDITSQYEANTIVVDPQTGDAYISTKAVPYGVALSNEGYWTRIYNYASEIHTFREQIAADEQLSTTATASRSVDDLVFLNGLLYRVTAPMIAGDSYVEGSNCVKTTINAELLRLHTSIGSESQARSNADNALGERIDDEAEARAEGDTALGERIDDEAEARAEGDTALGERIAAEAEARAEGDTALGERIDDETQERIKYDKWLSAHSLHDSILVIGDSYVDALDNCAEILCGYLHKTLNVNFFISAKGGAGFSGANSGKNFRDLVTDSISMISDPTTVSAVLFLGGCNDAGMATLLTDAVNTLNYTKGIYTNADIFVFNDAAATQEIQSKLYVDRVYARACCEVGASYNYIGYILKLYDNVMNAVDLTHPTADGQKLLAGAILTTLKGGLISSCYDFTTIKSANPTWNNLVWLLCDNLTSKIVLNRTKGIISLTVNTAGVLDGTLQIAHIPISIDNRPTILIGNNGDFIKAYGTCMFSTNSNPYHSGAIDVKFTEGYMDIYLSSLDDGWTAVEVGDTINLSDLYFECTIPTKWI